MRRYYGIRRATALLLGATLALGKARYLAPDSSDVPYEVSLLVERYATLAAVCFGVQMAAPLAALLRRRRRTKRIGRIAVVVILVVVAISCVPPTMWLLLNFDEIPPQSAAYLTQNAALIGSAWAPLALLGVHEWLRSRNWFQRIFATGHGASSAMASARQLQRRELRPRLRDGYLPFTSGIPIGRTLVESTYRPQIAQLAGDAGTLMIGAPRSGKSVRFWWPMTAMVNHSLVLVDPKGHALRLLAGRRSDPLARDQFAHPGLDPSGVSSALEHLWLGRVFPFDPYGLGLPYRGIGLNVVGLVDPTSDYCRVTLSAISSSLVIPSGDESHWSVELSRLILEGLLLHVRTTRPAAQQNLPYLADLFAGYDEREGGDADQIGRLIDEMRRNPAGAGLCVQAAQAWASLEGREVGIVASELARSLKSFTDPVIRRATCGDATPLIELVTSRTPVTIFLSMPFGALHEHSRVLRVIISCALRLVEQRTDKSRPVSFFLDEFASYASNLKAVREAAYTLGGAGARLHISLQYIRQLEQCLGRETADSFESSSNLVAAGVGDLHTAEYLSKRFGRHLRAEYRGTWPFRTKVRDTDTAVLDPQQVMRLLDRSSPLGACLPAVGAPFLFETLAYKPMRLHGTPMDVWPLPSSAFDDHLLDAERGRAEGPTAPPAPAQLTLRPQRPPLRLTGPQR